MNENSVNRSMNLKEWTMLVALSALWGGSFFFNEIAVTEVPVLTVVLCRVGLAAIILLITCRVIGVRMPREAAVWAAFIGMGLLNNVIPFGLIVWGQTQIASGVASILNATTPLFTVIVAHYATMDERLTPSRLLGVLVGFAGVGVMIGSEAVRSLGMDLLGQIAVLGAAASYAVAGVFGRRFRRMGVQPLATATGQVSASALGMLPIAMIVDQPWSLVAPSLKVVGALVGIAALSTALAYVLYFRILATAGATNLLLVTFLIPVSAILLGVGVIGEVLLPRHLVGVAFIGVGLAAIDGRIGRGIRRILAPS